MSRFALLVCGCVVCAALGFFVGRYCWVSPKDTFSSSQVALLIENAPRTSALDLNGIASNRPPQDGADEPPSFQSWERLWRKLEAEPASPLRDKEKINALEQLASKSPVQALSVALAETNRQLRIELVLAGVRGWASTDLYAAAAWTLTQSAVDRYQAASALLTTRVKQPEEALGLADWLLQKDPKSAREIGAALISTLAEVGAFAPAAEFSTRAASDFSTSWISDAFTRWASYQPENALAMCLGLRDPEMRRTALEAVVSGWAQSTPASLADLAIHLPEGPERGNALKAALCNWVNENPKEAGAWILRLAPNHELDAGFAALAVSPESLFKPEVAMAWARNIVDRDVRSGTLAAILRDYSTRNPAAVQHLAQADSDLGATDRAAVLADLVLIPPK